MVPNHPLYPVELHPDENGTDREIRTLTGRVWNPPDTTYADPYEKWSKAWESNPARDGSKPPPAPRCALDLSGHQDRARTDTRGV